MRIIIPGGTGLIGKPLSASLFADGHEVIILSRNPSEKTAGLPADVQINKWDGKTADGWGHLADGADAIINLAGESIAGTGKLPARWSDNRKQRILQSRLDAGQAVVEAVKAAEDNKPKVIVQASAVGYYGQTTGDAILTEKSLPGSDFMGETGIAWEESTKAVEEMGVRRIVIRTGLVMTMDGGSLPFSALQFQLFAGGRLGNGKQWMSWIHMQDEIDAIRFLLDHETASGPFNLTAPNPVTNQEFTRILGQVLGRPTLIPAPTFAMRLALGEISTLVLDGQSVLPRRLLDLGFEFRYTELGDALNEILA